jgi:hypothetical protein
LGRAHARGVRQPLHEACSVLHVVPPFFVDVFNGFYFT